MVDNQKLGVKMAVLDQKVTTLYKNHDELASLFRGFAEDFNELKELVKGKISFIGGFICAFTLVGSMLGGGLVLLVEWLRK